MAAERVGELALLSRTQRILRVEGELQRAGGFVSDIGVRRMPGAAIAIAGYQGVTDGGLKVMRMRVRSPGADGAGLAEPLRCDRLSRP